MAEKTQSFGSTFSVDISSTMTLIPSMRVIGDIPQSWETIDVTTHDSPGGVREIEQTRQTLSTVQATIMWDPNDTTHQYLQTAFDNKSEESFEIVLQNSTNSEITFDGKVTDLSIGIGSIDDAVEQTVTITRTGPITITAAPA